MAANFLEHETNFIFDAILTSKKVGSKGVALPSKPRYIILNEVEIFDMVGFQLDLV